MGINTFDGSVFSCLFHIKSCVQNSFLSTAIQWRLRFDQIHSVTHSMSFYISSYLFWTFYSSHITFSELLLLHSLTWSISCLLSERRWMSCSSADLPAFYLTTCVYMSNSTDTNQIFCSVVYTHIQTFASIFQNFTQRFWDSISEIVWQVKILCLSKRKKL